MPGRSFGGCALMSEERASSPFLFTVSASRASARRGSSGFPSALPRPLSRPFHALSSPTVISRIRLSSWRTPRSAAPPVMALGGMAGKSAASSMFSAVRYASFSIPIPPFCCILCVLPKNRAQKKPLLFSKGTVCRKTKGMHRRGRSPFDFYPQAAACTSPRSNSMLLPLSICGREMRVFRHTE